MVSSEPASSSKGTPRRRTGAMVLVGALFAGVLVASIGVGYSATQMDLSNATADLPRGNAVVEANGETQRVEAEARALASGKEELETVTLRDGRVAVVNNTAKTVQILSLDLTQQGQPLDRSDPAGAGPTQPERDLVVVPAKDGAYVVDPVKNVVEIIDPRARPEHPVVVPGGASGVAVPDGADGIWVLTDDRKAAHVVRGRVWIVSTPDPVDQLTLADGRPVVVTESGTALDIAAEPLRTVTTQPLPHGLTVVAGSPKGAGRYLLLADRTAGTLVVVDPRTASVKEFSDLPTGSDHDLGAPVVLDDRVYVPDYLKHRLYVRDLATDRRGDDVVVPGNGTFSLETRDRRIWANDQFDRGAVTIGRDGHAAVVDKGSGPGVDSDTTPVAPPNETGRRSSGTTTTAPPTQPRQGNPPPTTKNDASNTTTQTQTRMVTVPTIPAGTTRADACQLLTASNLRCEYTEVGSGGPPGTVRDMRPAGGSRVPEHSVVRLEVYGPILAPDVRGKRTDAACRQVTDRNLTCTKQPMPGPADGWTSLDVVDHQDPGRDLPVTAGAVTVTYWDRVRINDLTGKDGVTECTTIMTGSNNLVLCQVAQGGNAPSQALAGTVVKQSRTAGQEVRIGETVVLTIYQKPVPLVPSLTPGTQIDQACQTVQQSGYQCVRVADGVSRGTGVTSQQPPGGTPQDGGDVIVHYSPEAPKRLWLWANTDIPEVWAIRLEGQSPAGHYTQSKPLGYAYPVGTTQTGVRIVHGFTCDSGPSNCLGASPNHYYTGDTANPYGWIGPTALVNVLTPVGGSCRTGQMMIYRYGKFDSSQQHRYTVDLSAPKGYKQVEPLGCVWNP